jgi:hypothetical protein
MNSSLIGVFVPPFLLFVFLIGELLMPPSGVIGYWFYAVLVITASGFACWTAVRHFSGQEWLRLVSLGISAALSIVSYALIYANGKIQVGGKSVILEFKDAVYYSMVTFTTLGYGDMSPSQDLRLIAASEAVLGYLYLGLLIGMVSNYTPSFADGERR